MTREIYQAKTKGPGASRDEYIVVTVRGLEGAIVKVKANDRFVVGEKFVSVTLVGEVD